MIDICDALRELLEPGSGVTKDDTCAMPFTWTENNLYAYPASDRRATSDVSYEREDFTVEVVFVADAGDEEAQQQRHRTVSEALEAKALAYLAIVNANRTRGPGRPWDYLTQVALNYERLRTFNKRGVALRITGWRATA